jgi:hypothetical protein
MMALFAQMNELPARHKYGKFFFTRRRSVSLRLFIFGAMQSQNKIDDLTTRDNRQMPLRSAIESCRGVEKIARALSRYGGSHAHNKLNKTY